MTPARPYPGLVDSHCHLQQLEPGERERALDRARERGVEGFLVPALHLDEAEALFELAAHHADVWLAIGVHPHEAKRWSPGDAERLSRLADHDRVVAIGECGLDFHYDFAPRDRQLAALTEQWEVAVDAGLPAVVHNRESDREMLEAFRAPRFSALTAVFHSFAAGRAMAAELLARPGVCLGISGMVTFPAADNVREVLAWISHQAPAARPDVPVAALERLLVETDTPFLAPVPYRGRPNEPAWVVEVAERTARELGMETAELCRATGAAFARLFPRTAAAGG